MTLQVKIGASSQVYDSVDIANAARGRQKLSIIGSGEEIKTELAREVSAGTFSDIAAGIGSIKATSDITLDIAHVTTYKDALQKLGTRSVVVDNNADHTALEGTPTGINNFKALDAVYTKLKAFTLDGAPQINAETLAAAVNLQGLEGLSGRKFNVVGTDATIKANMSDLLKNISRIGEIHISSGTAVFTADQLSVLGDKLKKDGTASVTLRDTASNLLTTSNLALVNKFNNTNVNDGPVGSSPIRNTLIDQVEVTNATVAQVNSFNTLRNSSGVHTAAATARTLPNIIGTVQIADSLENLNGSKVSATVNATLAGAKVNAGTDTITTATNHNLVTGDLVTYSTTGTAIGGLTNGTSYIVKRSSATTFQLYDTKANATAGGATGLVDLTGYGTGTADKFAKSELVAAVNNLSGWYGGKGVTFSAADVTAGADKINKANHGFVNGDIVQYSQSGTFADGGLTHGSTYYVGGVAGNDFKLYTDLARTTLADLDGAGTGKFDTLSLASKNTRVTINGVGLTTAAQISGVATKAKANDSNVAVTYSAKSVDIQSNIQAINDNLNVTGNNPITEIIVNDGLVASKKAVNVTMDQYNAMHLQLVAGLLSSVSNYALSVSGASVGDINNLQVDTHVAQFSVKDADNSIIGSLASYLGNSKLKTLSTSSSLAANDKVTLKAELSTIGSNVDRAKLKFM